jgi:hypothetical protein
MSAWAEATVDFGFNYSSDTLTTTAETANTQYFYNLNVLFNLDRKMTWNMGWIVMGINQVSTAASVESTYTSFDFGPALRWNIDKDGIFSTTIGYGYIAKGTYSSGSTEQTWQGTSLFGQFAIQAPIRDDKFYMGFSLNYYSATYPTKIVSSVESANEGAKTWIFPMISITWLP